MSNVDEKKEDEKKEDEKKEDEKKEDEKKDGKKEDSTSWQKEIEALKEQVNLLSSQREVTIKRPKEKKEPAEKTQEVKLEGDKQEQEQTPEKKEPGFLTKLLKFLM